MSCAQVRGTLVSLHALFQDFSWPPNSFKNQKPWGKHAEADDTEHLAAISGIKVLPSLGCLKVKNLKKSVTLWLDPSWTQSLCYAVPSACAEWRPWPSFNDHGRNLGTTGPKRYWNAPTHAHLEQDLFFDSFFLNILLYIEMSVLPQNIFDRKKLPRNPLTLSPSLMARPDLSNLRANRLMDHSRLMDSELVHVGTCWYMLVYFGTLRTHPSGIKSRMYQLPLRFLLSTFGCFRINIR